MSRFLTRLMDAQAGWARALGEPIHAVLHRLAHGGLRPLFDLLNGRWLGHPLHAAITDIPIGVLYVAVILDLLNQRAAADVALVVVALAMLGSALTGLADYADTDGTARVRASLHATVMVVTLVLVLVSLGIRAGNPADRTLPVVLSVLGAIGITIGAYVGGDVVYVTGNMVDRHAFRGAGGKWLRLEVDGAPGGDGRAAAGDGGIPEGTLVKARLGVNTLVLVRSGDAIHALHETCAHAGGPLSKGRIVDGCIECPWHASRFRMADGAAVQGPTVYGQPVYEVRRAEAGGWEARRVS